MDSNSDEWNSLAFEALSSISEREDEESQEDISKIVSYWNDMKEMIFLET